MEPLNLDGRRAPDILRAAQLLRQSGVVVIPTDTVYGLSASVFQPDAVERIFRVKQRPADARVPLLIATAADLPILVSEIPRVAWLLIDRFWPGPLTLVLPANPTVPALIRGNGETVAVRIPAARSCLEILQVLGEPVVGTSANISGQPPALTAANAAEQIGGEVDAIVADDAAIIAGVASTVVELTSGAPIVHRQGAINIDVLAEVLGAAVLVKNT